MKAKELLLLTESLINLEGNDAQVFFENGRDGQINFTGIIASLERRDEQQNDEIFLVIRSV